MKKAAITIDVEPNPDGGYSAVKEGLPNIVKLLKEMQIPFTMFISCEVLPYLDIEKYKDPLIEIASHGHIHRPLTTLHIDDVKKEIVNSKEILEKKFDCEVMGFRAVQLKVNPKIMEIIAENYYYDSSILILRKKYSNVIRKDPMPYTTSSQNPVIEGNLNLLEIPVTAKSFKICTIPLVGSYIRVLPTFLIKKFDDHPLLVFNLHSHDPVKFKTEKVYGSFFAKSFIPKLCDIINYYNKKYRFYKMRDI